MSRKASASARTPSILVLFFTSITILVTSPVTSVASVSFKPVVAYDAGVPCLSSMAVGDVNADGKPDVLTVSGGGCPDIAPGLPRSLPGISVLLGNEDGTFQSPVVYDSGGVLTTSLQVADVNGDGKPDVLAASICSTAACQIPVVAVLLGNGDGTFQSPVTYDSGLQAWSLAVADLNKDGKLDLVVAGNYVPGRTPGLIGVLLGNGDGTFQSAVTYGFGKTVSVALSDVNGDGTLDALVTIMCADIYCSSGLLGVLLGNGDGTFQPELTYDAGYEPTSLAVADLNGDGKADALVTNILTGGAFSSAVGVLLGHGDGTFAPVTSYNSGSFGGMALAAGDINLDGEPDVVVAHCARATSTAYGCPNGSGVVGVLLGNGDGTLQPAVTFSSRGPFARAIALADVSGDGRLDVLVANAVSGKVGGTNGTIGVMVNSTTPMKRASSITLATNLNPSIYGQRVTFTARVRRLDGSIPPGTVFFRWTWDTRAFSIGSAKLDANGVAILNKSNLNAYSYPLTAVYQGDTINARSVSPVVQQVVLQTTSAAKITSSLNPSRQGQPVTFTAQITSPTVIAAGPVTFTAGTTVLGSVQLSGGKAKFTTSSLPAGSPLVKVTYQGNSNIKRSSAAVTQIVQP